MKNQLIAENIVRRILKTTSSLEDVMEDKYLNEFKQRLSVGDVIIVDNGERKEIYVTQIEPFVKTEFYMDTEQRIRALEEAVFELTQRKQQTAA